MNHEQAIEYWQECKAVGERMVERAENELGKLALQESEQPEPSIDGRDI